MIFDTDHLVSDNGILQYGLTLSIEASTIRPLKLRIKFLFSQAKTLYGPTFFLRGLSLYKRTSDPRAMSWSAALGTFDLNAVAERCLEITFPSPSEQSA